jgi:AcrR family transcriptional regulator
MTANRIKEVALMHFAEKGYEGTSMSQIADDVGIKKQSIYTHFKRKDDLFLHVMKDGFMEEFRFVTTFLENHKNDPLDECLFRFLLEYKERYDQDDNTKFWLRMSFFPPGHLYEQVMVYVYELLDKVESLLIPYFDRAITEEKISPIGAERAATAFLGVLDAVFIEMLYGGNERTKKRIEASWYVYWRGVSRNSF